MSTSSPHTSGNTVLGLCYASCILLLTLAGAYGHSAPLSVLKAQQSRWQALLQAYLSLPEEQRIFGEYYPAFQKQQATARSMEAHRLHWMGQLDRLGRTLHLPSLHYEIGQAEPWPREAAQTLLFQSEMRLRMGLAHEADLLSLLATLADYPHARMRVSQCQLRLAGRDIFVRRGQTNIHAECVLHWLGFLESNHADQA